jgi:hypothetical protein
VKLPVLDKLAPREEKATVIRLRADKAGNYTIKAQASSERVKDDAVIKVEESQGVVDTRTSPEPAPKEPERSGSRE